MIAKEVFRKFLHMLAFAALILWLYALDDWRQSVLITACAFVVITPCLILLSRIPGISEAVTSRVLYSVIWRNRKYAFLSEIPFFI
jgi:hypothetical protein